MGTRYSFGFMMMLLLVRRNSFFLRHGAYAFAASSSGSSTGATSPTSSTTMNINPVLSNRVFSSSSSTTTSSRLFSSVSAEEQRQHTTEESSTSFSTSSTSSMTMEEQYRSITTTSSSGIQSFGGLCYVETPEYLQRVIFVLGGPGSGKGTQSDLILEEYPCVHLSAGQLLRDETKKEGSPHAAMIEDCLVSGKIVPVAVSLALLAQAIHEAPGKSMIFLVDGFPRNFDNLDGWSKDMPSLTSVAGVLHYDCPLEVLEKRILQRAKDSGRSDDNLESLRKRFHTFQSETIPVVNTLRKVASQSISMQVFEIEANRPIETVWRDTQSSLNSVIANDILVQNKKLLDAISTKNAKLYASLCSKEMVDGCPTVEELLKTQELKKTEDDDNSSTNESYDCISKAQIEFMTGTKAKVSYHRSLGGDVCFVESRLWSHTLDGWKMIHFFRSPPLEGNPI